VKPEIRRGELIRAIFRPASRIGQQLDWAPPGRELLEDRDAAPNEVRSEITASGVREWRVSSWLI
jgi:hypothetical protein